jgi:hypothetical protein
MRNSREPAYIPLYQLCVVKEVDTTGCAADALGSGRHGVPRTSRFQILTESLSFKYTVHLLILKDIFKC